MFFVCSGACRVISKAVDKLHEQLQVYVELIRQVSETTAFTTPQNAAIVDVLQGARQSFDQLNDILNGLDRRGNILGLFLMDALFLSDYFLVRRFLRWQRQYLGQVPVWIDAISEIDGLVSMATFRYNEPQAGRAEVVASEEMVYEAVGLYHPFLGAKAVRNDFTLQHRHYYIITGANMAGKSTFLRALGINYILAMNGMPVFATSLRVSAYSLFSSMRTTDDLAHGISYFNAELLRLKQRVLPKHIQIERKRMVCIHVPFSVIEARKVAIQVRKFVQINLSEIRETMHLLIVFHIHQAYQSIQQQGNRRQDKGQRAPRHEGIKD